MNSDYDKFIKRITKSKCLISMTWDDAPHLSDAEKAEYWEEVPPHEREARSKGIPSLGSGAVWPVDEKRIKVDPFEIPEYWPVAYAVDPGWNNTAAIWGAWDRDNDRIYIWSDYKASEEKPVVHVSSIQARGKWIPGVMDPASRGRAQGDGIKLLDEYTDLGLNIDIADNAVEAGIFAVYKRMVSDRLKIFGTCVSFWDEFRMYQRDKNGQIVKDRDHVCDCLRYLVMSGMSRAVTKFEALDVQYFEEKRNAANATTGY